MNNPLDPAIWAAVPFHFWSVVFFAFGCLVGSFLNVCIHRLPLEQSVVSPPSHCPHCKYSIPWYLNVPLITWLWLRGKCANCRAPISVRYFVIELLTGVFFLLAWLRFGEQSALLALVYCLVLAGFIVGTATDFEHLIIPDEVTKGGMVAGVICSFLVPQLHATHSMVESLTASFVGLAVGGGALWLILNAGKMAFGRQKIDIPTGSRIIFGEDGLHLPDRTIPYEDIFYRESDTIHLHTARLELPDRCYRDANIEVSLLRHVLKINEEALNPEEVPYMALEADSIDLPREAMGLGDVKLMAAIGAFTGWEGVLFTLTVSSMLGAGVGLALKLQRLAYVPYIAAAATIWIFFGRDLLHAWLGP
jgi:leader peptidase (prepilin peptidase) / N-methyltransferase